MLDTVVLLLERSQFEILAPERFDPPAHTILSGVYMPGKAPARAIQNPTKQDMQAKNYKPRLTIIRRRVLGGCAITLKIEFSIPKLLFGNNFDEACEDDFEKVLDLLELRLQSMGVQTRYEYLRKAKVSAIHYSKNICMVDHTTCTMIMQELEKANIGSALDTNRTDYRNGGRVIRSHANSYEIVIYDKKADMQAGARSEKRGLERDYYIQTDLFDWGRYPRQLEVLRFEIRLSKRAKLRTLLKSLGFPDAATFDAVFKQKVAKRVVLYYWDRIQSAMPLLALGNHKPEDIFEGLAAEQKCPKPSQLLQLLGAYELNASIGEKQMRSLIIKYGDARTWQRIKRKIHQPSLLTKLRYNAVDNVGHELRRFETVKMEHLLRVEQPKPKSVRASRCKAAPKPRRKTVKAVRKIMRTKTLAKTRKRRTPSQSELPFH